MGLTPNVGTGQVIQTTWGNQIRDRTAQRFANRGELDAQWAGAGDGSVAYLEDVDTFWGKANGLWVCLSPRRYRGEITAPSGHVPNTPTVIPGLNVTFTAAPGGTRIDIASEMAVVLASGTSQAMIIDIRLDGTSVAGRRTQVDLNTWSMLAAGRPNVAVGAGAHTVQLYLSTQTNTGYVFASAIEPAWLTVTDRG